MLLLRSRALRRGCLRGLAAVAAAAALVATWKLVVTTVRLVEIPSVRQRPLPMLWVVMRRRTSRPRLTLSVSS